MLWTDATTDDYSPVAHRHHPPPNSKTSSSSTSRDKKQAAKKKKSQSPKYMDDDEKRRNFLERNRQGKDQGAVNIPHPNEFAIAALKCRQRKKQWLNNLQAKVEYLTNDNEQLQLQTSLMREEVMQLRNMLWTHNKQCHLSKRPAVMMPPQLSSNDLIHPMMTPDSTSSSSSSPPATHQEYISTTAFL